MRGPAKLPNGTRPYLGVLSVETVHPMVHSQDVILTARKGDERDPDAKREPWFTLGSPEARRVKIDPFTFLYEELRTPNGVAD